MCTEVDTATNFIWKKNTILSKNCKLFAKKYTKYLTFPKTKMVFSQLNSIPACIRMISGQ